MKSVGMEHQIENIDFEEILHNLLLLLLSVTIPEQRPNLISHEFDSANALLQVFTLQQRRA